MIPRENAGSRNGKRGQPEMETDPRIPDKLYFKIREAASITGLPPYVLRFWETEFAEISPKRTESGQRLYRKKDIETILRIKRLLYDEKFTIEGARNHLRRRHGDRPGTERPEETGERGLIHEIKRELRSILDILAG